MAYAIIDEYQKLLKCRKQMEEELDTLPQGYVSEKTIRGKTYHYLQNRVNGKMSGQYLKGEEVEAISKQIHLRRKYEEELPEINARLDELERAAQLIGHGLDRRLMLLKVSVGMDDLPAEQKRRSTAFANSMNAIEGVPASEQTMRGLDSWQKGEKSYLSLFEETLQRYGFRTEVQ